MSSSSVVSVVVVLKKSTLPRQLQIGETGRPLNSMFFKRGRKYEYVRAGSTFRRVHRDKMVETATVISVAVDSFGIPHVQFEVSFRRPNRNFFDGGARMLEHFPIILGHILS